MSATAERTLHTPEDVLEMPDGDHLELVDGETVEKEMGFYASLVGTEILALIRNFVQENRLGWTPSSECGYQCFPESPRQVRKPDASFIALERMPADQLHEGHVRIPPDLAVEVVSPHDRYSEVARKREEYLRAGVRLVWVVDPPSRTVTVYRTDGSGSILREEEELSGEDVLPGFRCLVGQLFPGQAAPDAPA
jgi:Uma2 family endonuclease